MLKLLRANFFCLRRSRALLLCAAAAFAMTAFYMLRADPDGAQELEVRMMQTFPFLPVLHAAFASLFLGLEYQDGTLRNKLIAGHSRASVYLAALAACTTGCFVILLGWALGAMAGIPKFGWFSLGAPSLLLGAALILLLTAALAAILTLLCMLLPNRAAAAVASILLMFGLIVLGSLFYNALCEPEMLPAAVMTVNGFEVGEPMPNPAYISGALRDVYQLAVDALPTGQSILLANQELARPVLSLCASACIAALVSAAGILAFRRKNMK